MKSTLWKIGIAVAALGVVLAGGVALAERTFGVGGPGAMHRHMAAFITGALDAAKADPAQRRAIDAARERAMTSMQGIHAGHRGEMKEAIALFEADKLDASRVEAIKAARLAEMTKAGDAIVGALTEAHGVLRPEQRKAVADYIRANKPSKGPGFRSGMMKRMVSSRLDSVLDEIDATDAQRTAIEAARDHVFAAFDENVATIEHATAEKALALFEADKLDQAQISALRADHQARASRIADAMVQAIHDVHDALTPAQRKQVADEIRDRMSRFERHAGHEGHHGAAGHPGATTAPTAVPGEL